jgi:hypothetical protein
MADGHVAPAAPATVTPTMARTLAQGPRKGSATTASGNAAPAPPATLTTITTESLVRRSVYTVRGRVASAQVRCTSGMVRLMARVLRHRSVTTVVGRAAPKVTTSAAANVNLARI